MKGELLATCSLPSELLTGVGRLILFLLQVMRAPLSGRSRNFGFCRFANEQERDRALVEMNSHEICGRPVRVSLATARKTQSTVSLDVPTQGMSWYLTLLCAANFKIGEMMLRVLTVQIHIEYEGTVCVLGI